MWGGLFGDWWATSPAICGKLPHHADFVRSGMRHGELEAWASWLDDQRGAANAKAATNALPVAFVLPPGNLAFARRRFVLGVMAPSVDKVRRLHPLVVYQQAHPRWVLRHFEAQWRQPCDWQFWLARALARHTWEEGPAELSATACTVKALWRDQKHASAAVRIAIRDRDRTEIEARNHRTQELLDRCAGAAPRDDPAAQLHGVCHLPWADWPQRLSGARVESAFWQQDAQGRFVGAANGLHKLWGGLS